MRLLCLFLTILHTSCSQILELDEDDVCRRWWGTEWRCKKIKDCPVVGDVRRNRPMICSFDGRIPIVCCPPGEPKPPPIIQSPARDYCEKMEEVLCRGSERPRRPVIPGRPGGPSWEGGNRWRPGAPTGPNWWNGRNRWQTTPASNPYFWPPWGRAKRQLPEEASDRWTNIVQGEVSLPKSRPYMALIGFGPENEKEWNCGGSLISDRFVVSAAHCAKTSQGPALWIRLGELDLSTTEDDAKPEDFSISKTFVHPDYKGPAMYNDIVLFGMDRPVQFSKWIRPTCLHTLEFISQPTAGATGWGRTDFVGDTSAQLMEVELTLVNGEECKATYGTSGPQKLPLGINTDMMICAGERQGGKDTCAGDSGGPLVVRDSGKCLFSQIGITSFGRQCGLANSPGVYTRISYFVPWIESIVWA